MLRQSLKLVPPLLSKFHKGQLGRVLVVGGSEDYSGAPYFAAMASALVGADMSHVLCTSGAGAVIKGYSPNLMIHPYLTEYEETPLPQAAIDLLSRIHVVLIGPGLGRDEHLHKQVRSLIGHLKELRIPLVFDADGLWLLQQHPGILEDVEEAVLTPNVVEFGRLLKAYGIDTEEKGIREQAIALAKASGAIVLVKGSSDIIANATEAVENHASGSPRRVSGQGDTLSGTLLTFMAWKRAWASGLWDTEAIDGDPIIAAAYGASTVARRASALAFQAKGRGMVTTDVNDRVGEAFEHVFPDSSK